MSKLLNRTIYDPNGYRIQHRLFKMIEHCWKEAVHYNIGLVCPDLLLGTMTICMILLRYVVLLQRLKKTIG